MGFHESFISGDVLINGFGGRTIKSLFGEVFALFAKLLVLFGVGDEFTHHATNVQHRQGIKGVVGLEPITVDIKVEAGDKVKLSGGALDGFVGTVMSVDANASKCKVEVEMFGRPTPVDVELSQIEIID
jgi:transcription antitermination factor NusG